jgi:hypothetical protein
MGSGRIPICQAASGGSLAGLSRPSSTAARTIAMRCDAMSALRMGRHADQGSSIPNLAEESGACRRIAGEHQCLSGLPARVVCSGRDFTNAALCTKICSNILDME